MNQCMNKRIDDWMDGWMDDWATSLLSSFFTEWPLRWGTSSLRTSSLSSLSYFLSLSCSGRAVFFLVFSWWNRALATATFCRPHAAVSFFLRFWSANRALATVLCTFCRQLLQIEARNWEPTWVTPGATSPEKTQGFAPESVFTHEFTRGNRTFALPNYTWWWWCGWHNDGVKQWLCDWHDAGVKMMMWLTWWWCGWHDDVNANHDHRP